MKRFVESNEETTNELTDWVGVVFDDGSKGAILYIGGGYHIICNDAPFRCNRVCGGRERDGRDVQDTLQKWEDSGNTTGAITTIFCFYSYKELMSWFVESM